jgi:hypothetical protein
MNEMWPWPAELDAVVAAPEFHTILYEDDRVRVLEGIVPPGVTVPLHTHCWGGVLYLLGSSNFVRRGEDGEVIVDTRTAGGPPVQGSASWGGPLTPHTFENVGASTFHTVTVELKDS